LTLSRIVDISFTCVCDFSDTVSLQPCFSCTFSHLCSTAWCAPAVWMTSLFSVKQPSAACKHPRMRLYIPRTTGHNHPPRIRRACSKILLFDLRQFSHGRRSFFPECAHRHSSVGRPVRRTRTLRAPLFHRQTPSEPPRISKAFPRDISVDFSRSPADISLSEITLDLGEVNQCCVL